MYERTPEEGTIEETRNYEMLSYIYILESIDSHARATDYHTRAPFYSFVPFKDGTFSIYNIVESRGDDLPDRFEYNEKEGKIGDLNDIVVSTISVCLGDVIMCMEKRPLLQFAPRLLC